LFEHLLELGFVSHRFRSSSNTISVNSVATLPPWRQQSSSAVTGYRNIWFVEFFSIPQLASNLAGSLIKSFTIIGGRTPADLSAVAAFYFDKPIRIREGLPCHANNICITAAQNRLRLFEGCDSSRRYDWCSESSGVYCMFYRGDKWHSAAKGTAFIGQRRGHAFITALTCVRINRLSNFWLFGVFELASF